MSSQKYVQKYVVIRDPDERVQARTTFIVPVINPQGTVKFIRVNPFINGAATQIVMLQPHPENTRLLEAHIKPSLHAEGWMLVADAMHEHFGPVWLKVWKAYQEWVLEWANGGQVSEWPAKYTPPCVEQRRHRALASRPKVAEIVIPGLDGAPDDLLDSEDAADHDDLA